jgi:hypothetical protein
MADRTITRAQEAAAEEAGRQLARLQDWPEEVPEGKRLVSLEHCPFSDNPNDPEQVAQRKAWLKGLADGLSLADDQAKARQKAAADIEKELS